MAKKAAEAPRTLIAFEFAGRTTINAAGERVELVTVTARRGEVGYVADVEMRSIEADLLPVIRRVHSVFFKADTEGLPSFPDIEKETAPAAPPPAEAEAEQAYTVSFYGSSDAASDEETGEPGEGAEEAEEYVEELEQEEGADRSDDYYAEVADEYDAESGEGEEASPDNQHTMF